MSHARFFHALTPRAAADAARARPLRAAVVLAVLITAALLGATQFVGCDGAGTQKAVDIAQQTVADSERARVAMLARAESMPEGPDRDRMLAQAAAWGTGGAAVGGMAHGFADAIGPDGEIDHGALAATAVTFAPAALAPWLGIGIVLIGAVDRQIKKQRMERAARSLAASIHAMRIADPDFDEHFNRVKHPDVIATLDAQQTPLARRIVDEEGERLTVAAA